MNAYLAHEAEQTSRLRFKAKHTMDYTIERIENLLNTLLPPTVVADIRQNVNATPPSHKYYRATIAQSDLCGFTKLASTRTPQEVVRFIGELFGLFDDLTDKYEIYKVETVGDAYIAGQAESPLTEKNKPISVVLFGLDMVRKTHEWARGMGENVSCRVGVHSGECIGGIVGTEMQRYHLFGDLMSGLEVLESTAPEGKVQVSKACKEACEGQMVAESLPMEAMMFEERTEDCLKTSKGERHEFDEIGGRSYTVRSYAQLRNLIVT
jgi:guanylate cyclase